MATAAIKKRGYIYSIQSYLIFGAILLGVSAYFGYQQINNYFAANDALKLEQDNLSTMQTNVAQVKTDYANLKKQYDEQIASINDALQFVLPEQEAYTNLVRIFDQFSAQNNSQGSPFFVSDVKFGTSRQDAKNDYSILPVTMTINASKSNLMKFLQFIENSGMLENKTRLMDIRSISINFSSADGAGDPTLNVSLAVNAYFQKTKTTTTNTTATTPTN